MDNVAGSLSVKFNLSASKTRDVGSVSYPLSFTKQIDFTFGDGANQIKVFFDDDRSLADGANEELDLAGSLVDAFGDVITMAAVKFLYIENKSTTQTLSVGGAAATAFEPWALAAGDGYKIPPLAFDLKCYPSAAGWASTGGAADKLKILNSAGAACIYRIVIGGDLA